MKKKIKMKMRKKKRKLVSALFVQARIKRYNRNMISFHHNHHHVCWIVIFIFFYWELIDCFREF